MRGTLRVRLPYQVAAPRLDRMLCLPPKFIIRSMPSSPVTPSSWMPEAVGLRGVGKAHERKVKLWRPGFRRDCRPLPTRYAVSHFQSEPQALVCSSL